MNYVIFDITEKNEVDYSQVLQTSAETLRVSTTNKAILKWEGQTPSSVLSLQTKGNILTEQELRVILEEPEWNYDPQNK